MATYVADAAWGRPSPAELIAWGYTGIICYCSPDNTGKNITRAEVESYLQASLKVGLVWEWANQRASEGGSVGTQDATEYVRQAQALGAVGGVLWMVGEDPTREPASDYPTINSYMAQAHPILHDAGFQLGGYASEDYLVQAHQAGVLERLWLVGGWSQDVLGDLVQQSNNPAKTTNNGQVDCNYAPNDAWGWTEFSQGDPDPMYDSSQAKKLDDIWQATGNTDAASDPNGHPIPPHWVWGYTWAAVEEIKAQVAALSTQIAADKDGQAAAGAPSLSPADRAALVSDILAALRAHPSAPSA